MRRLIASLVLVIFSLGWVGPASVRAYTLQHTDSTASVRIKWPSHTITVALSSSLSSPPANIKPGSDVLGAVRRSLARWAEAAGIQFVETQSDALNISPSGGGDGVSLITIADTAENRAVFMSAERTGRTRIFYDPATGAIAEADVVLNPVAQFSTDGTPGTYDLEATLTHEVGHILGLEHSDEAGAAMQPRQGTNGLYEQAAVCPRTLSDDDRAGALALYGSPENFGSIAGTITDSAGALAAGAHVWAEDASTGRVVAGNTTLADGSYRIEGLPPGQYRLVTEHAAGGDHASEAGFAEGLSGELGDGPSSVSTAESAEQVHVATGATLQQNFTLGRENSTLRPHVFGSNGHLSTIAVPIMQGQRYTIFVGGQGVDQIEGGGVTVSSPFIKVNPASLTLQSGINYQYPIVSFEVEVGAEAALGDYTVRLQTKAGEVAYISGGLTIDEAAGARAPAGKLALAGALGLCVGLLDSLLAG
ncbi:MAG TPA: carboxypeptidase regulatory-like domain-containing protein [Pyrinomonadaceae bacterium]|nr:carboxypeptidase regulatory-like domain-containing protein [Pyrinomonadaceae bacterium]